MEIRNMVSQKGYDSSVANELLLNAVVGLVTSTMGILTSDDNTTLSTPKNFTELNEQTKLITNLVNIKIKNSLLKK